MNTVYVSIEKLSNKQYYSFILGISFNEVLV